MKRFAIGLLIPLAWSLLDVPAATAAPAVAAASLRCEDLARDPAQGGADFAAIPDAPTRIVSAKTVDATADIPGYCQVQGYVAPSVGFELRLPAPAGWNGKFFVAGSGGWGGELFLSSCDQPLRTGYACLAHDMGHRASTNDALWAYNNLQGKVDFAYRATHVVTLAGKAIVAAYFGRGAHRSYYIGCSQGGRQGLISAQRFPWDFDGIIAGAPQVDMPGHIMGVLWDALSARDEGGQPVFTPAALHLLHDKVVERCDLNDGLKDGLIGDPRQCKFDPSELSCGRVRMSACLTPAQVRAASRIYGGPVTSTGQVLFNGGLMRGSELSWTGMAARYPLSQEAFRYLMFMPEPGPRWHAEEFDFDHDYQRLGLMASLYAANNPDLRQFKGHGGKIISYEGWSSPGSVPVNIIDYYETVTRTMGGRAATEDFFRLFLIPGMGHCTGGEGAYAVDYISYLDAWVERGEAPRMMIGAHPASAAPALYQTFPQDPRAVEFTRPLYPYPQRSIYSGSGDPNSAASFHAVEPVEP